ncbi:MAG TPA: hypothetical protein VI542_35025 [Candidatus Tectomicrobia bacterium]
MQHRSSPPPDAPGWYVLLNLAVALGGLLVGAACDSLLACILVLVVGLGGALVLRNRLVL